MNIIVKADLDAALDKQRENGDVPDAANFKKVAMTQAVDTLTSSIDKFGLTSPVIRQQGEDQIYIEIPGQAVRVGRPISKMMDTDTTASIKRSKKDAEKQAPAADAAVAADILSFCLKYFFITAPPSGEL